MLLSVTSKAQTTTTGAGRGQQAFVPGSKDNDVDKKKAYLNLFQYLGKQLTTEFKKKLDLEELDVEKIQATRGTQYKFKIQSKNKKIDISKTINIKKS